MVILICVLTLIANVVGSRNVLMLEDFQTADFSALQDFQPFEFGGNDFLGFVAPESEIPCLTDFFSLGEQLQPCENPAPPPPAPSDAIFFPFPQPSPIPPAVIQEFYDNKQKWEDSNVRFYNFTISRSCFCLFESVQPVDVTVCRKKASEPEYYEDINTIDKVFDFVESFLGEPQERISITYDPTYGFIMDFFADRDAMIADEEIGYTITDFQVLRRKTCSV